VEVGGRLGRGPRVGSGGVERHAKRGGRPADRRAGVPLPGAPAASAPARLSGASCARSGHRLLLLAAGADVEEPCPLVGRGPSGGARLYIWRDTLRLARGHWAVGTGPETFTAEFARVQSAKLARAYPDFHHESPHNIFLDALAAQGLAGPVILLLLCGLAFRSRTARAGLSRGWRGRWGRPLPARWPASSFIASLRRRLCTFWLPPDCWLHWSRRRTVKPLTEPRASASGRASRSPWPSPRCSSCLPFAWRPPTGLSPKSRDTLTTAACHRRSGSTRRCSGGSLPGRTSSCGTRAACSTSRAGSGAVPRVCRPTARLWTPPSVQPGPPKSPTTPSTTWRRTTLGGTTCRRQS